MGLVGGVTGSKRFNALIQEINSENDDFSLIPHGSLMGQVTVPFGITTELNYFPKITINNISAKSAALGLKWTFSQYLPVPLVELAVKVHYSKSNVSYGQLIQNQSTGNQPIASNIIFENKVRGVQLLGSVDLPFVEPFVAVGIVEGRTDFNIQANGSATIFENSVLLDSSGVASSREKSFHYLAGVQFKLFLLHFSLEYAGLFGTQKYSGKFSVYF
ncbi:MAG: hypothetical protein HOM21_17195 [Halobacteriovoraceae bacterium]|nr:hypothetical protein [Halobacteriovoraceae bacterium]